MGRFGRRRDSTRYGLGATAGVLLIGWLLLSPTSEGFYDSGTTAIECASVLGGVPDSAALADRTDREQGSDAFPEARTSAACAAVRERAVGLSVLLSVPTASCVVLAVLRRRQEQDGDAAYGAAGLG